MEILLKVFYSKSILSNIKKQIKPQNKQGIENTQLSSRKGGGWVTLGWGLKYSTPHVCELSLLRLVRCVNLWAYSLLVKTEFACYVLLLAAYGKRFSKQRDFLALLYYSMWCMYAPFIIFMLKGVNVNYLQRSQCISQIDHGSCIRQSIFCGGKVSV